MKKEKSALCIKIGKYLYKSLVNMTKINCKKTLDKNEWLRTGD